MCEAEWLTLVFTLCPFRHTVSELTNKKLFKQNYQWDIYWLISYCLSCTDNKYLFCFAVDFLFNNTQFDRCFEYLLYSILDKPQDMQRSMQLIMMHSAAVPTVTGLQSRVCIHLKLLMHSPSAANGKYHCKSLTRPRASGATESQLTRYQHCITA